jgi:DNA-directed RNA polymerase specialized sigma24 family protein
LIPEYTLTFNLAEEFAHETMVKALSAGVNFCALASEFTWSTAVTQK